MLGYGLGHRLRHGLGYGFYNTLYTVTPFLHCYRQWCSWGVCRLGRTLNLPPLDIRSRDFLPILPKIFVDLFIYPKYVFPSFQIFKCRLYFAVPPLKVPLGTDCPLRPPPATPLATGHVTVLASLLLYPCYSNHPTVVHTNYSATRAFVFLRLWFT